MTLLLLVCAGSVNAQQTFGYVLDVRGEWLLNGNPGAKLSKGSSLSVGGVITAADASDGGSYIVIADRSGKIFEKRTCSAGECAAPIRLPNSVGANRSYSSRIFGEVIRIVGGEPAKYAAFISRGSDLQEAVLKLDAQKLDLSQVFKNIQGNSYLVRFEKIGKNTKAGAKPLDKKFEWDSQKPKPLDAKDLGPGLYRVSIVEVSLLASEEESESSGNEAWVLVTTPKGYAKAAPSFEAALKVTRQWGDKVRQSSVRQFLRATLEFITTQSPQ